MQLVYTNENRLIVGNVKNILEAEGIEIVLKNEFASGAMGEVSPFDTWVELWVRNDSDYERAVSIIENAVQMGNGAEWFCRKCHEKNDGSFEICWNCQAENT